MTRALRKLVKGFYILIAIALILLAVLVQSGRSFSPSLGDYEPAIERYLSGKFNARIEIGQIKADWDGLKPNLDVRDLTIKSHANVPILAFKQAHMRLDILASLRNGRLVWSNLSLGQVKMDFIQTADGAWQIAGLPKRVPDATDEGAQLDGLVDMLLLSSHIEFKGSHLHFQFTSGEQLTLDSPSLLLENADNFHRLAVQVDVDAQPRSVFLIIEGRGDPRDQQDFRTRGYVQLNRFPTSEPVAAASAFLLGGVNKSTLKSEGTVDATIWFESRAKGDGFDLSGRVGLQTLSVPFGDRHLALDGFATELTGHWLYSGEWQLALQNINAGLKEQRITGMNFAVSSSGLQQPLTLSSDRVDVAHLTNLLNGAGALGEGKLREVLLALNPRGTLKNLKAVLPLQQPKAWQLKANIEQVGVNAWNGVPALSGVDGYVQAGQQGGFVDITSHRGFSMHYSPTYTKPMVYDEAVGQIAWRLQPENNQIYVNSGALDFRQGEERTRGYMWLSLPWQRNTGDIDLYLQIGATGLNASRYSKYTPAVVPASLLQWLEQSIGETNSGTAQTAGFVYRGTLNTKNAMARSHQLYLDIKQAELAYHPGWPALTALDGRLLVNDAAVSASITQATLYNSKVEHAEVRANPRAQGKGSLLQVTGSIQGQAGDGLRILREGMLRQFTNGNMDSWSLSGDMHAALQFAIPIGTGEEKPPGHYQQVDIDLVAPSFNLRNLDLHISDLGGRISYNSERGIASEGLRGVLFNEPITAQLSTQKEAGFAKTLIKANGTINANTLAVWSKRPEILFLQHKVPYNVAVELRHRARPAQEAVQGDLPFESAPLFADHAFAQVMVTSDLAGVAIDLPAPYGKPEDEKRPFRFTMWLQDKQSQIDVSYNGNVQALLRFAGSGDNSLQGANIALASEANLSAARQFLISGYLPEIDLEQWKTVQTRYDNYTRQLASVEVNPAAALQPEAEIKPPLTKATAPVGTIAGLPFRAEITLGHYDIGALKLEDLAVTATRSQAGWRLGLENPMIAGDVLLPGNSAKPLQVNLQRLYVNQAALGKTPLPDSPPMEPPPVTANPDASAITATAGDISPTRSAPAAPVTLDIGKAKLPQLDPRELPLADIAIHELYIDGNNYGNWSLQIRPNNKGVVFDNIRGTIRGVTISRTEDGLGGAKMIWQDTDQGMQTRFTGSFTAGDIGAVLQQWNKPATIESTHARFRADLYWAGTPQDFQLVELNGDMTIWMEKGRFQRNAGAGDGILRLMAVLNFDSLARRMRLDFTDLYKSGLAYDDINGKVRFSRGSMVFEEPLLVRTPSSGLQMAGTIDLRGEQLNTRLVATLPVAGNLTFFAALATGLPAAAGIYLVSKLFKKQVDQATSISYTIRGSWDNPQMRFDRLFESEQSLRDSVNQKEAEVRPKRKSRYRNKPAKEP